MSRNGFLSLIVGAAAILCVAAIPVQQASATGIRLFGTNEIGSNNLSRFEKWLGVLDRYSGEAPNELQACQPTATDQCHVARWRIFLNRLAEYSPREQLDYVNQYLNQYAYILDPINYGRRDYWATPREFMYRTGDCEDYAISKYVSLLHLGWSQESMRIVVLNDLNLDTPHAILVVYFEGQALVLDNQIPQVIEADRIRHYEPIFSINEDRWWLHRS
ncbi:MAG: transglutaminase-like cysteine peptidase [Alphaproteobacteria bacterium]